MGKIHIPRGVRKDSKVALIAPASQIKPELVERLTELYEDHKEDFPGGELIVYPSAREENAKGTYAASLKQRVADFRDAWSREDIDLVICARGGYGCVHLLDYLDPEFISAHAKWLIGFSDVSALHALLFKSGIASVHGGMAKQLVENTDSGYGDYRRMIKHILESDTPHYSYRLKPHRYNQKGEGSGILIGGNLAVLNGLGGTPYDLMGECLTRDCVLFIEDIGEPIYAVERMLYRLHLQGVLQKARGVLIGQFTEWKADRNYEDINRMIHDRLKEWGIECPVAFDFPTGHNEHNVALIEGSRVHLTVNADRVELKSEE